MPKPIESLELTKNELKLLFATALSVATDAAVNGISVDRLRYVHEAVVTVFGKVLGDAKERRIRKDILTADWHEGEIIDVEPSSAIVRFTEQSK